MKYILTFIGGLAVGILTGIGICVAEEGREHAGDGDEEGNAQHDKIEDACENGVEAKESLLFRDFSGLKCL